MPRPALATLSVSYRRIPILSIGRDIYLDTRLIISKLETLFPPSASHPPLSSASADSKAFEKLLEYWVDGYGVFARGSQLIHPDTPLMRDERFRKDREQMGGRSWSVESQERGRPEAVVEMREAFRFLEEGLLSDGRQWIIGTEGASLADLEGTLTVY
jgi:glutathione S-transferase